MGGMVSGLTYQAYNFPHSLIKCLTVQRRSETVGSPMSERGRIGEFPSSSLMF